MNYQFPIIEHIDDVIRVINGRKDFIMAPRGWYTIINYIQLGNDTFPPVNSWDDAILRECRGLAFDANGYVLSRPFHKFFNFGERLETLRENVSFTRRHAILEKIDGSMIRPLYRQETRSFELGTKMGVTDVARQAMAFVETDAKFLGMNYEALFQMCLLAGYTPILEWTSRQNRIVIDYPEDALILTAIRHNRLGFYLPMSEVEMYGRLYSIPVVKSFGEIEDFEAWHKQVKQERDVEGYVVRFDNGHMFKMKADQYVLMHKSKDIISTDHKLAEVIMDVSIDDLKPLLVGDDIKRVERMEKFLLEVVKGETARLETLTAAAKLLDYDRKAVALASVDWPAHLRQGIFKVLDGTLSIDFIRAWIKRMVRDEKSFLKLKEVVFARFDDDVMEP